MSSQTSTTDYDGPRGYAVDDEKKTTFLRSCSDHPIHRFIVDCLTSSPCSAQFAAVVWTRRTPWEIRIDPDIFTSQWNKTKKIKGSQALFRNLARVMRTMERMRVGKYRLLVRNGRRGLYKFLGGYDGNDPPRINDLTLFDSGTNVSHVTRKESGRALQLEPSCNPAATRYHSLSTGYAYRGDENLSTSVPYAGQQQYQTFYSMPSVPYALYDYSQLGFRNVQSIDGWYDVNWPTYPSSNQMPFQYEVAYQNPSYVYQNFENPPSYPEIDVYNAQLGLVSHHQPLAVDNNARTQVCVSQSVDCCPDSNTGCGSSQNSVQPTSPFPENIISLTKGDVSDFFRESPSPAIYL